VRHLGGKVIEFAQQQELARQIFFEVPMRSRIVLTLIFISQLASAGANRVPVSKLLEQMIRRSTLVEPGGRPFYLRATITDRDDSKSEFNGTVEEYWLSPTKWRRVIKLRDFSQTRIVNGDLIYEENNGDYFPVNDEMLANEIVDPLPKSAVDLMNQLGLMGAEPGSGRGQCMAEKYFNNSEGSETRVLLAYDCDTGLLIYLWSPTCCYGVMTDYRKFHNKMVAYATKDNPINIRIDTLKDLNSPDESLFAIAQPTPPSKRIIMENLTETETRTFLISKTEIQWPPVSKNPPEKSMKVNIVIGRDGRVKEARTYSPVENAIEDAALTAVEKWIFQPQNVEGVPAQISTSLTFSFPADYQKVDATQPQARPMFDRMRATGDLRLDGAPGFHMKASFHSEDGSAKGTYEETWVSPKKWRREVSLNDTTVIEMRTDTAYYRTFPGKYAPRLADDVMDAISFSLPGDNGSDFHDADWSVTEMKLANLPVLRLSAGYISPQGKPDPLARLYFVEDKTAFLRGRYHYSMVTIFNGLKPFGDKTIARKLIMEGGNAAGNIEITIDLLEPTANISEEVFTLAGVKPVYTFDAEDRRYTQPVAVYTVKPSLPGWHGQVTCAVKIDEHGHVRDVDVKGTADESVIKPIRAALMSWEYEPATVNGHPSLGFVQVNVE
jgi:TonB family protein